MTSGIETKAASEPFARLRVQGSPAARMPGILYVRVGGFQFATGRLRLFGLCRPFLFKSSEVFEHFGAFLLGTQRVSVVGVPGRQHPRRPRVRLPSFRNRRPRTFFLTRRSLRQEGDDARRIWPAEVER